MDLLTRKKLLLRKYNNNVFSNEQLDFFSKINATEIIVLLKQNPHLRECRIFFEHLSIREVEKIIASIFEPEESFIRSEIFNIIVNILRNNTMLLEICFRNQDFNYMSIFGFLEEEHIDYPMLILLEDVLLPYIRKTPFQMMDIIANDEFLEEILLRRIYQKPVFKIMYTVMFCLSKRHSQTYKENVKKIIHELVQTPFTYLMHKEKVASEKISIIAQDKTEVNIQPKPKFDDSSKDLPPIHTKKVKERKVNEPSVSQQDSHYFESTQKLTKKLSLGEGLKTRIASQSDKSTGSPKKVRGLVSAQITSLQELQPSQHRSITSIDSKRSSIVLNEDLDYGDLTFNMKDLLSDIAFNLKSVDLTNVIVLLDEINEPYINALLLNCNRFITNDEYEGYCQGVVCILMEFGEVYKAAVKLLASIKKEQNHQNTQNVALENTTASTTSQADTSLANLITKLQKHLNIIASKIPSLCSCILQNNEVNASYSSGERLKKMGMTKFKMLELISQLLESNSKTNSDSTTELFNLKIDFVHFDIFYVAQKYLTSFKWNNFCHCLLVKLTKLCLEQDYVNFKNRYIEHLEKPKDGILGTLIQLFRNKKFVFLKNMKFTNYGNIHAIYEITKEIVTEVKNHGDYEILTQKFPVFDSFVNKDLPAYEQMIEISKISIQDDLQNLDSLLKSFPEKEEMNDKSFKGSIESAEELIYEIQNSKRWTPQQWQSIQRKQGL